MSYDIAVLSYSMSVGLTWLWCCCKVCISNHVFEWNAASQGL